MSPPVFTVDNNSQGQRKATLNLLPCRIHHDGAVSPCETFWHPTKTTDNTQTAYFRGRKLQGKAVKLPEGYYGTVVEKTEPTPGASAQPPAAEDLEEIENPEDVVQVAVMKGRATFDELMVWGHESTTDATADPYVRGMEEWIAFAEEIHST
ncbi:ribonuclease H2, subunit C [Xylariaceae sp. FL0594]|nr:ribonuclease H2, subunit C [Xylariaceae sp. FL0594]